MTDSNRDDTPNSVQSEGGAVIKGDVNLDHGSTFVGRDQIINHIQQIQARALTAVEEARQARSLELEYLAQGVSDFAQRLRDRAAETEDSRNPYKGLLEYRLGDAEIFFGRERDLQDLRPRVLSGPLTVLHSESGAGKTSLLQAGLSPQLIAAGHLPLYCRPYDVSPALKIKQTLLPDLAHVPQLAAAPLRELLGQVRRVVGPRTTLVILLDQFEEFFIRPDEKTRAAFINELADCLEDDTLHVHWVLALRSEYFSNLATFRPRIRNPFENDYRLGRFTRTDAETVVARPADRLGVAFEAGLIDRLLDDLGQDDIAPPQIQLVCSALYSERGDARVITQAMYEREGGASGILRGHLERVLNRDVPVDQRAAARQVLEALISSEPRRVLRPRADLIEELRARGVSAETTDAVVAQLIDSRLVRPVGEGEVSYELVHDYLLEEIKLDPAVQARKAAQELLDREVQSYQRYDTLLSDDKLAILQPRRGELRLTPDAQALLDKSERAFKRRRRQRQRLIGGAVAALCVVLAFALPLVVRPVDTEWRIVPGPTSTGLKPVVKLAVDMSNPDLLFASNGTAQDLWRSTDGGSRWESIGSSLPVSTPVQSIAAANQRLYVATDNRLLFSPAADVIWRTVPLPSSQVIVAVALDPVDTQRIYVALRDATVLTSPDGGLTWAAVAQPRGLAGSPIGLATNGKTILIAGESRIFRSDDEGQTWQPVPVPDTLAERIQGVATVGQEGRFLIVGSKSGLFDADVSSPVWILQAAAAGPIYSVAVTDNAFYLGRSQDLLCRRWWFWPESGWWRWHLSSDAPCQGVSAK